MTQPFFDFLLHAVFAAAALTFIVALFIAAPYGKHERDGWGPGINMRAGWLILELPAFAFMLWFYWQGEHKFEIAPLILFSIFQIHYFHRTFIYPFQIRVKPGANYRIFILLCGMPFNAANGALNGWYLSQLATPLYNNAWLYDIRFISGLLIFAGGFAITKHSDAILRNLRKPGETGYKIPQGGFYRYVSCPNYMGEMIQWCGFAIAGWSTAGLAFVLFTAANLVPKAIASHKWYKENFADYPRDRKAIIPFIF